MNLVNEDGFIEFLKEAYHIDRIQEVFAIQEAQNATKKFLDVLETIYSDEKNHIEILEDVLYKVKSFDADEIIDRKNLDEIRMSKPGYKALGTLGVLAQLLNNEKRAVKAHREIKDIEDETIKELYDGEVVSFRKRFDGLMRSEKNHIEIIEGLLGDKEFIEDSEFEPRSVDEIIEKVDNALEKLRKIEFKKLFYELDSPEKLEELKDRLSERKDAVLVNKHVFSDKAILEVEIGERYLVQVAEEDWP